MGSRSKLNSWATLQTEAVRSGGIWNLSRKPERANQLITKGGQEEKWEADKQFSHQARERWRLFTRVREHQLLQHSARVDQRSGQCKVNIETWGTALSSKNCWSTAYLAGRAEIQAAPQKTIAKLSSGIYGLYHLVHCSVAAILFVLFWGPQAVDSRPSYN